MIKAKQKSNWSTLLFTNSSILMSQHVNGDYVLRNEKIYFNGNQFGLRVMMICNSNAKCRKIHRFICCVVVNVLDDSDYLLELERRVTSFLELCS